MVKQLSSAAADFTTQLQQILQADHFSQPEVSQAVSAILADVRVRGDEAVVEYTTKFDRFAASVDGLRVSQDEIDEAYAACDDAIIAALNLAKERIEAYHQKQLPQDHYYTDSVDVGLGWQWTAVEAVGLYVPGGQAAYPSSVLMNAVPAIVAGVERMAMVVPSPEGKINPLVLAAAKVAGISEVYKIGGAQAIGALAYGTSTIAPVNKIVGPGNAYVAEAKRQVFGRVGIDMIAGPSEILVIADAKNNPDWMAADLLSQAEHDADARSFFITDDAAYAQEVIAAVERTLVTLDREAIARKSWEDNGLVIVVENMTQAMEVGNIIAAEHVELAVDQPEQYLSQLRNAGAIFMGRYTPEAIGDYVAGPSHVLPTSCSAKFSSGLGVLDFMKRSSLIACSEKSVEHIFEEASALAKREGFGAHALSVDVRMKKNQ